MSFLLWDSADARPWQSSIGVASTRLVFRAAEVPVLREALQLLCSLGERSATHQRKVDETLALARRQGFDSGHAEGIAQGVADANEQWFELAEQLAAERQRLRAQVAELALAATRKVLGDLEPGERLAAAAVHAARQLLPDEPLELHVHASRVEALESAVARGVARVAWPSTARVVGDETIGIDDCRVRTAHGSIDIGIHTQLERLAVAWGIDPTAAITPARTGVATAAPAGIDTSGQPTA